MQWPHGHAVGSSHKQGVLSRLVHLQASPLEANLGRLGAVVGLGHFLEPRVVERLLGSDAMGRVVDEYFPQQVEEILKEGRVGGNNVLRLLACL